MDRAASRRGHPGTGADGRTGAGDMAEPPRPGGGGRGSSQIRWMAARWVRRAKRARAAPLPPSPSLVTSPRGGSARDLSPPVAMNTTVTQVPARSRATGWCRSARRIRCSKERDHRRRRLCRGRGEVGEGQAATTAPSRRLLAISPRRSKNTKSVAPFHCSTTFSPSQKVLARPRWQQAMTPRDYAALTPLSWSHVNPYGRFDLDMNARMALA